MIGCCEGLEAYDKRQRDNAMTPEAKAKAKAILQRFGFSYG